MDERTNPIAPTAEIGYPVSPGLTAPAYPAAAATPPAAVTAPQPLPSAAVVQVPAPGMPAQAATHGTTVNVYQQNYPQQYAQPMVITKQGPGMLIRTAWYIFIGWWLSGILMFAAGACIVSVILLPVGLALVNRLPAVMTLRPATQRAITTLNADGTLRVHLTEAAQRPMWQRALYFAFVGWWASLLTMAAAYFISLTIIGIPLALMILNRLPVVTTLRRN
jgi:uncharacterized membrane protein YccF (DUF307 family)